MVRFSRRSITQIDRDAYAQYKENDPSDDDIAQFIRERFARLNPDMNQIIQIFEILVGRQPQFQSLQNITQFSNLARDPAWNSRNRQINQTQPSSLNPLPGVNITTVVQQFVDDPFKGDINPGTAEGAKRYLKATSGIPEQHQVFLRMITLKSTFFISSKIC